MTWTGCGQSEAHSASASGRPRDQAGDAGRFGGAGSARRPVHRGRAGWESQPARSAGDELVAGALVLVTRMLEQVPPGGHVRPAAQQRAPLPLGHAAPHPELDPVVERVSKAIGPDRAAAADQLGPVLRRALDEKLVRVSSLTRGTRSPVRDPHVAPLLLIVTFRNEYRAGLALRCGPVAMARARPR